MQETAPVDTFPHTKKLIGRIGRECAWCVLNDENLRICECVFVFCDSDYSELCYDNSRPVTECTCENRWLTAIPELKKICNIHRHKRNKTYRSFK
jgi:hypothetical protein